MLVNTDEGDTWSLQEIGGWLRDTGFEDVRSLDAPGPSPLILATRPKYAAEGVCSQAHAAERVQVNRLIGGKKTAMPVAGASAKQWECTCG
jgi:hypothetical protein